MTSTQLTVPQGHTSRTLMISDRPTGIPHDGTALKVAKTVFRFAEIVFPVYTLTQVVKRAFTQAVNGSKKTLQLVLWVVQAYFLIRMAVKYLTLGKHEFFKGGPLYRNLAEIIKSRHPEYLEASSSANQMKQLGTAFMGCLPEMLKDKPVVISHDLREISDQMREAVQNGKIFAIPLIFSGLRPISRNHITTLIIDPAQRLIYFMDPKGYKLSDYERSSVFTNAGLLGTIKMTAFWSSLDQELRKISTMWTLVENTTEHQKDGYNCGVHFYHTVAGFAETRGIPAPLESLELVREERRIIINEMSKLQN